MNTFPVISRKPSYTFSDEKSDKAVLIGDMASGYPLLKKLFTFDPRTFTPVLRSVPEADKLVIMAFYEANKDVPFYYFNKQDATTYEVIFLGKPRCGIDGQKDRWRIALNLLQSSP